jgi:hypothetical protein
VDHPRRVGGGEPIADLRDHLEGAGRILAAAREILLERLALEELHRQVGLLLASAEILHPHDVGVTDGAGGPRLALEAPHRLGVGRERRAQKLQRHPLVEVKVLRGEDLADAALAELGDDAIAAVDDLPDARRGCALVELRAIGGAELRVVEALPAQWAGGHAARVAQAR